MAQAALKLQRGKPVSVAITCSNVCWKRIGKLAEFERANRGWTLKEFFEHAVNPITDKPLCHSTYAKLIDGDYKRGGPFIPTLFRIFCIAFKSSGYRIELNAKGSRLTNR